MGDSWLAPSVPIDYSRQAIEYDPFLTDDQKQVGRDILERAGLLAGGKKRGLVSTGDIVRAAVGYVGGRALLGAPAAFMLGKILGLNTQARTTIQQAGGLLGAMRLTGVWR